MLECYADIVYDALYFAVNQNGAKVHILSKFDSTSSSSLFRLLLPLQT